MRRILVTFAAVLVVTVGILALPQAATAGRTAKTASVRACHGCPLPHPCHHCWHPPVGARWQYQLQGRKGTFDKTGGIDVGICKRPFTGGSCVDPDVFDMDFLVDQKITGNGHFVVNRAGVRAIHKAGGHAIAYIDAGDAETFRPDYHRLVHFDKRCDGCLIGQPFSKVFPDEFFMNLNNNKGQRDFILKVMRDRLKKAARAGFDGVEWDIVDTYDEGHTGFHISYRTQLKFDTRLANLAHDHGMTVALKNDAGQVDDLLPYFDYAVVEQCFQYHYCTAHPGPGWDAFIAQGKPVFEVEYRVPPRKFCAQANSLGFSSIHKARNFSLFAQPYLPCQ
jgi:endo-alpha-1,4-polygalactosaminidase (GH114 family)